MKMNWGVRILFLYLGFAGLIIFLVASSMNEKIDLVTPDYYEKELAYQHKKESIERNNGLSDPANIHMDENNIIISYPTEFDAKLISGNISIFRPSDKNLDFTVDVNPDSEYQQVIPSEQLQKGMYRISVSFSHNNLDFFTEKQIVIR